MKLEYNIVEATDFPGGLRCIECHNELPPGSPYADRMLFMHGDVFGTEIVCIACELEN